MRISKILTVILDDDSIDVDRLAEKIVGAVKENISLIGRKRLPYDRPHIEQIAALRRTVVVLVTVVY